MTRNSTNTAAQESPTRLSDFDIESELERTNALVQCVYLAANHACDPADRDAMQNTADAAQKTLRVLLDEMEARRTDRKSVKARCLLDEPEPTAAIADATMTLDQARALHSAYAVLTEVLIGFTCQPRFDAPRGTVNPAGDELADLVDRLDERRRQIAAGVESFVPRTTGEADDVQEILVRQAMCEREGRAEIAEIARRAATRPIEGMRSMQ